MQFSRRLPRLRVVPRQEFLVARCAGKSVLHLGATDSCQGMVCSLHRRLTEVADHVVGLDIDREGIEKARAEAIQDIHYGDLERLDTVDVAAQYQAILAGEVIEHLSNPGLFLEGIKRFFGPAAEMIVTTPDAFSLHRFLLAFGGREYVHPDHVSYYSYSTLSHLLQRHGFAIQEEFAYILGGRLRSLRQLLGGINSHFASGLVFVVKTRGGSTS